MSAHQKDEEFRQFSLSAHPLRLLQTPEDQITVGVGYFRFQIFNLIVSFFNTVFIAVERSRGHSRRIMFLNLVVIPVIRRIRRLSEEYEKETAS